MRFASGWKYWVGGVHGLNEGKWYKGNEKTRKAKPTMVNRKESDTQPTINDNLTRKVKEKGNTDNDPTTPKAKGKATTVDPKKVINKQHSTTTKVERKRVSKGKGKRADIVCYYCGKPGHTSDKCRCKGQKYNIDQSQPVWSVPNDSQPQQLQQMPLQSSASTTIMTQLRHMRLENMSFYEQGSFHTAVNSINAALTINKDNTTTDQLKRWAAVLVLIDTGAITSVTSREHFTHIPLKPLRKQDPQTLTA
eukprot:4160473-Amphidinium_carterae.1